MGPFASVLGAFGVVIALVAGIFVILAVSIGSLLHAGAQARTANEVRLLTASAERSLLAMEVGLRGHAISGSGVSLEPYERARHALAGQLAALQRDVEHEAVQEQRAVWIAAAVGAYEREYAAPLLAHGAQPAGAAATATIERGDRLLGQLRERFATFASAQSARTTALRRTQAAHARNTTNLAAWGCVAVALLLIAFAVYLVRDVLVPVRVVTLAARRIARAPGTQVPVSGHSEARRLARAINQMSESLRDQERDLKRSTVRFKRIMDSIAALVYIKDTEGRYLLVNGEFERVRGVTAREVLGHTEQELTPGAAGETVLASDREVIDSGEPHTYEVDFPLPDGVHTFRSVKFPLQDAGGSDAIGGIATDITDLRRATAQAEEASRLKSQFVANMSHEIRTPLNGVVGMASLLREGELDATQRRYADALAASSDALMSVINDILDFSKLEAGGMQLEALDMEPGEVLSEAVALVAAQGHAKGVKLGHTFAPGSPRVVRGDPVRLRQVLLNLLANAVKFTADGEVTVHVSPEPGARLRFEVRDTGIGIDAEQAESLFAPFAQADASTTREYGGTGLGLAISREIVTHMGGEIGARPREGGGSVFWFTAVLPEVDGAPAAQPGAEVADRAPATGNGARPRVLVAEDNEVNRVVAQATLTKLGWASDVARNGREAVAMALSGEYGVVLMDCQMPELDGYEATRRIRDGQRGVHIPIVAMTAQAMPGDRERCIAAGMDDYLTKPIRAEELRSALERIAGAAPSGSAVASPSGPEQVEGSAPATAVAELLDAKAIKQLYETLTDDMRASLLDTYEESVGEALRALRGAVQRDDQGEVRRLAHGLKGSSAMLGAARLRAACQAIEHSGRDDDAAVDLRRIDGLERLAERTLPALRTALCRELRSSAARS